MSKIFKKSDKSSSFAGFASVNNKAAPSQLKEWLCLHVGGPDLTGTTIVIHRPMGYVPGTEGKDWVWSHEAAITSLIENASLLDSHIDRKVSILKMEKALQDGVFVKIEDKVAYVDREVRTEVMKRANGRYGELYQPHRQEFLAKMQVWTSAPVKEKPKKPTEPKKDPRGFFDFLSAQQQEAEKVFDAIKIDRKKVIKDEATSGNIEETVSTQGLRQQPFPVPESAKTSKAALAGHFRNEMLWRIFSIAPDADGEEAEEEDPKKVSHPPKPCAGD
jgi:hypothetical protein